MSLSKRFLSQILADQIISNDVLKRAETLAEQLNKRIDEVLVHLGQISASQISKTLVDKLEIEFVEDAQLAFFKPDAFSLSHAFCQNRSIIPLEFPSGELRLAMLHPLDEDTVKLVQLKSNLKFDVCLAKTLQVEKVFEELGGGKTSYSTKNETNLVSGDRDLESDLNILREAGSDAPIIRLMDDLVRTAFEKNASDIHIRPNEYGACVSYRVDGRLNQVDTITSTQLKSVISRLKILSQLDVSETRIPQDGKFQFVFDGSKNDIRVATMPQINGEGAVLRILGRKIEFTDFRALGFEAEVSKELEALFSFDEGLALVVGPTGSGKSTTLYTALNRLAADYKNIITIEDPVEYQKEGTAQIQVDEAKGLTFPVALRAALRQDPDIILVGEIRDEETARIAVQAALTGHIVLATLHTSNALSSIPRLIDMGIEPFLLSAVLKGVVAQRLFPKRCNDCQGNTNLHKNCNTCGGSGVSGRQVLAEVISLDSHKTELAINALKSNPERLNIEDRWGVKSIEQQAWELIKIGKLIGAPANLEQPHV